ncbi:hypothetical protein C5167_048535 [Papaver somniferum]|uniref:Uncharacterized protein n=1 Tax=Papaver somniferum TaxID=3469 RepID=A0A4Y7KI84_PAPSO|nr:hypothetical protein C5167_048535 [Papaver somniferum]
MDDDDQDDQVEDVTEGDEVDVENNNEDDASDGVVVEGVEKRGMYVEKNQVATVNLNKDLKMVILRMGLLEEIGNDSGVTLHLVEFLRLSAMRSDCCVESRVMASDLKEFNCYNMDKRWMQGKSRLHCQTRMVADLV